ncbi:TetR/AcrR family transcriptional regulator C-terminal domain-containing protein [Phycicoccus endophyticus]|uniref:TetR/AcrR family transcriptional regulator C-terminal domain-containing protein n=1 Tax=Phycicoccus endophyticus TaxID=1690220 RepID=A0A7G9R000_9MICO|nr:TetR/AcrR family transcriptional regulator C-terminal domain-containing protein [Phycicoccus endophyticus]NHI20785.1 TetR family transcriptional regulator [Phycicoccus endophyticus]QNN48925.1 TetR/AcrR family transcriptional regulator C-terminal domain-containing protein [Phycicoccus endophyticus]GGL43886.1 putative transcriptional regulator, TetR family protein [Phycicoccus endophyticus]
MTSEHTPTPEQAATPARPLGRELIVQEAIAMIDEHGLERLTMRSLGARLGVDAMALYRHVNGREDLLEGIVAALVDQIQVDPDGRLGPTEGWQGLLQWLARSVRQIAIDHPRIFPLVATRHPAAPWLRPPLRSLRVVEDFLRGLTDRGFSDTQAVETYRAFTSFLLGHLLLEVAAAGATTGPVEQPLDEGDADLEPHDQSLDVTDYPLITRTRALLSEDHTERDFEVALEALLDRLDLALSQ